MINKYTHSRIILIRFKDRYLNIFLYKVIQYVLALVALIFMGVLLLPQPVYSASNSCPLGTTMNFVAHEDDDILFLNPDIQNDIFAGRCVVTVYLTAGDAGLSSTYWLGRESGAKAAYSIMNSSLNFWTQQDAGVAGHPIPVFTLASAPNASLIFLRIPDGNYDGTGFSNNNFESLQKLWQGNISSMTTVDNSSSYAKQSLIDTLLALMNAYQPDIIRTQNFIDPFNSTIDHSDHYSTAYLAQAASQLYATSHILIGYYDYEINSQPQNIFGTDATAKQNTFISYAQYDPNVCQTVIACTNTKYGGWFVREYTAATITPIPTTSVTPTPSPSLSPTPTPTPGNGTELLSSSWSFTGNNGASENNIRIPSSILFGMTNVFIQYNLHGVKFGTGDDEASIIFIQNNDWYSANLTMFGTNGLDGLQIVSIPLSTFHKVGSPGTLLDLTKSVTDLHARFWNGGIFTVDLNSIEVINGSVTPTPTPTITPTPTVSTTPTPTATPTPTPTPFTNIAPLGSGYRWSQMSSATGSTNQVAATGMNDNNTTVNISLNGGPDDNANAYEGAGVIWTSGQNNITRVEYVNGSWDTSLNGAFTANFQLQTSIDGTTWVNTGLNPTVAYDYDSPASSGKTYVFNGILPNNLKGIRVIGQVRTNSAKSWVANTREIMVETGSVSSTPTPTITPTPTVTITPTPTTTPTTTPTPTPVLGGSTELLTSGTWTLAGANGAAENDIGIASGILLGKSSLVVRYDLHGSQFGSGADEASIVFIQNNAWYAVNIIPYGVNEFNGTQTATIPLSVFRQIGGSGILDLTKSVSNLHSRFWNKNTFAVDIYSVNLQ